MRSNDEVPVGKLRRRVGTKHRPDIPAHTRGSPKRRKGSACTRESSKRRKGISVGPTALEPPAQGVSLTSSTDKEVKRAEEINKGREGDGRATEAAFSPPPPAADTVILCKGKQEATPLDLFNLKRSNIWLGPTTYACSIMGWSQKKSKREITKIYCCAMVDCPQGWTARPSYREPKKKTGSDPTKCRGKIAGHFRRDHYYFRPHGTVGHACHLQHGGRRSDPDFRPPLMTITAPPSWGITDAVIDKMITSLQSSLEDWWDCLPGQGTSRKWLKRIGEASTPAELDLK